MAGEDAVLIAIPLVWSVFLGLPLVGLKVSPNRRELFEKISNHYFKFTGLFTTGALICLLGEEKWVAILDFLISGHIFYVTWGIPTIIWTLAGYQIYSVWRDLIHGLRGEGA